MSILNINITEYARDTGYGKVCVVFGEPRKEWKDIQRESFDTFSDAMDWIMNTYEHKDEDIIAEPDVEEKQK